LNKKIFYILIMVSYLAGLILPGSNLVRILACTGMIAGCLGLWKKNIYFRDLGFSAAVIILITFVNMNNISLSALFHNSAIDQIYTIVKNTLMITVLTHFCFMGFDMELSLWDIDIGLFSKRRTIMILYALGIALFNTAVFDIDILAALDMILGFGMYTASIIMQFIYMARIFKKLVLENNKE